MLYTKKLQKIYTLIYKYYFNGRSRKIFTQNIPAAMEVFNKLRNLGTYCCLKILSDYNYVWDVVLTESELGNNPEYKIISHRSFEYLPIAICLIALDVKGIKL